jgi:hypothetical protein
MHCGSTIVRGVALPVLIAFALPACGSAQVDSRQDQPVVRPWPGPHRATSLEEDADDAAECGPDHPHACWTRCFEQSNGEACRVMARLYETTSADSARRLYVRACDLGACMRDPAAGGTLEARPAASYTGLFHSSSGTPLGAVSSPGSVIVYGRLNGRVRIAD